MSVNKSSATYSKYRKLVGKLLVQRAYIGLERKENGDYVTDEKGNFVELSEDRMYLVTDIIPAKHYRKRYAIKLMAYGDYKNLEVSASQMFNSLKTKKKYDWRFVDV